MMRLWCEGVVVHIAKGIHGWYEVKNCFLWKGGKKKKTDTQPFPRLVETKNKDSLTLMSKGCPTT